MTTKVKKSLFQYRTFGTIYFFAANTEGGKNIAFMASIPTIPYDKNMLM